MSFLPNTFSLAATGAAGVKHDFLGSGPLLTGAGVLGEGLETWCRLSRTRTGQQLRCQRRSREQLKHCSQLQQMLGLVSFG